MSLADLARPDVITVAAKTPVPEIAMRMNRENVGCVVVLDGQRPVGIVTDRDLALRVLATRADPDALTAMDLCGEDLLALPSELGLLDALKRMSERGVRRAPVLAGEDLAGIITLDDIVLLLAEELTQVANVLRAESPPF